ncbi:Bcpde2 [Botrytis cinerea B05.10]|uniref:Phosphodiesterase n=2 Tax=Botryotinia fuckeliana TaxID=40559 RepID=A0A384JNX9_BOTFB|nr:Bcpde2 [Botrytis cinerea B05.10]ATZ52298.1 Bcpde2 [Botrytis cinerea B05.10]EMR85455.1 putative 3 5 -cyclic nucleotide phosphodiesterase protein [Botrytis cinerea BcDW1]
MDYAACNIVYVDRRALEDKLVRREDVVSNVSTLENSAPTTDGATTPRAINPVDSNVNILLTSFTEVHVCTSGKSCMSKVSDLNRESIVDLIPTLVLIEIPHDDQVNERPARDVRTPSPSSKQQNDGMLDDDFGEVYGIQLLQWVASEIQQQRFSKLVVPVAVVSSSEQSLSMGSSKNRMSSRSEPAPATGYDMGKQNRKSTGIYIPLDQRRTMKLLDIGALDVITSPLLLERLPSLAVHAYRAHKDASKDHRVLLEKKRGRKRSWVGVEDQKPYAYLREEMVSRLMEGICTLNSEEVEEYGQWRVTVSLDRRELIARAISSWHFSAHDFEDDELLYASSLMFQHALSVPELEKWRISTENLTAFLITSREAYNSFVPYHNFRHVVDVLQAIFHFLVRLGSLPEYPPSPDGTTSQKSSPIAELIRPFDALTLMITAIGHDVGHPGVNNAFLVHLNAPLAQLYNDRSVLESFHCAAYSQILRRHWLAAFEERDMRHLMISTILATDMGLHFDYMKKLGYLQEKLHENGGVTDGWNGRTIEDQRTLACSLLIKCADISNVARKFDTATRWTEILTDEFARQASMEQDLGIPTALYAAPVREVIELGKSQIGFMNMFAIPLFGGVTDVMPGMAFCVEELERNKAAWESRIALEQERMRQEDGFLGLPDSMHSGMRSPRTMSVAQPSQDESASQDVASRLGEPSNIRVQAMLNKGPFRQNSNDESPKGTRQGTIELPQSATLPDRRSSKPSYLQLSYATASAPGLLDHSSQDVEIFANGDRQINGVLVQPSLSTDVVVVDPPTPREFISPNQRISETTTEGSNSGSAGEWSAGAATNNKSPFSPSTQATSFASEDSNNDRAVTPTHASPLINSSSHSSAGYDKSNHSTNDGSSLPEASSDLKVLAETGRNLKKKPSRFRMNGLHFWKRKNGNPPMPAGMPDKQESDGTAG